MDEVWNVPHIPHRNLERDCSQVLDYMIKNPNEAYTAFDIFGHTDIESDGELIDTLEKLIEDQLLQSYLYVDPAKARPFPFSHMFKLTEKGISVVKNSL